MRSSVSLAVFRRVPLGRWWLRYCVAARAASGSEVPQASSVASATSGSGPQGRRSSSTSTSAACPTGRRPPAPDEVRGGAVVRLLELPRRGPRGPAGLSSRRRQGQGGQLAQSVSSDRSEPRSRSAPPALPLVPAFQRFRAPPLLDGFFWKRAQALAATPPPVFSARRCCPGRANLTQGEDGFGTRG